MLSSRLTSFDNNTRVIVFATVYWIQVEEVKVLYLYDKKYGLDNESPVVGLFFCALVIQIL
jgi:hypothetical protein